jgi:agmatine deiminase
MHRRGFLKQAGYTVATLVGANQTLNAQQPDTTLMPDYSPVGAELIADSTPVADGYRYPAEWEPHDYTIMVMPPPQN